MSDTKLKRYACIGHVTAFKFLGTVEARNPQEAKDKAWSRALVNVCPACESECEKGEIEYIDVEEIPENREIETPNGIKKIDSKTVSPDGYIPEVEEPTPKPRMVFRRG